MSQAISQRRHAGPFKKRFKAWEQPWHLQKFQPVRAYLLDVEPDIFSDSQKAPDQRKYLSHTAAVLEQGQDDLFGITASEEDRKLMTKLPNKLFNDFESGGGLCIILQTALKYKQEMGWKLDGFEANIIKDKKVARSHIALFQNIEKALLNAGLLIRPKVYIPQTFPKPERDSLKNIVTRHHGLVATSKAHATHELTPDLETDELDLEYCRTLETQDKLAKVHWWYYPDSYQDWKPLSEIQGQAQAPMPIPKLWKVHARFIRDLEKFNEWMNEEDYLDAADEQGEGVEGESLAEGDKEEAIEDGDGEDGLKRKRDDGDDGGQRSKAMKGDDGGDSGPAPVAKPSGLFRALLASLSKTQTGSMRAQMSLQTFTANTRPLSQSSASAPDAPRAREPSGEVVIVPSYASWFKFEVIHPIEKRAMSEWFKQDCVSKTPKTYVEARDLIINLYRESPRRYLTSTECRRHLAIDVCSVIRLHGFLEHWGLINYNISIQDKPVMIGPMNTAGHPILLAMPDGSLVPKEEAIKNITQAPPSVPTPPVIPSMQLGTNPNVFVGPADPTVPPASRVVCVVSGDDCTRERYHCLTKPEVVISPAVYSTPERIPAPYTTSDFVRVVGAEQEAGEVAGLSDWTETETLRLLEALEQFGEDWVQVEEYVGTKTKEQCIIQFLRLPIEDRYLDDTQLVSRAPAGSNAPPSATDASSTSTSSNVLAQIAFLCQSVSPDVANKAAAAAFHILLKAEAPGKAVEAAMRLHNVNAGASGVTSASAASTAAAASKTKEGDAASAVAKPEGEADKDEGKDGDKQEGKPKDAMDIEPSASEGTAAGASAAAAPAKGDAETEEDAKMKALRHKASSLTVLAAAALRAKSMAMTEEKEIHKLVSQVVKWQMEKIEQKLRVFEQLENLLLQERDALDKKRKGVAGGMRNVNSAEAGGQWAGEFAMTDQ